MANVTAGAAYKELEKVGDYVSPQINAAADRLSKQGMQQKQLNADAKVAADKRLDDAYASINVPELVASATGNQTRDDVARKFAVAATNRAAEYAEKAREAASKGDWKAMNDYKGRMKVIEGDFKNTVNDEKILADVMKGYQEAYDKGLIDDDDWLSFGAAWENYDFEIILDENDKKIVRAIELDDKGKPVLDENGKPNVMEKKWAEVVNQKDRPYERVQLEDKEGKKGLVGDMLATMGKRKYDTNTGQYITTTQTWDKEAEQQFMSKVKGLQSNDRMMYSLLKQASGDTIKKKEGFTEEDNKLVEDFLRFQVKGGYDTEESIKVAPRTAEQIEESQAKDRALTKRGQDLAEGRAKEDRALKLKQLALDEYKAKNPNKTDKMTKTEEKESEDEAVVLKFYELAKEVSKLPANADESEVQKVYDESGLGFLLGGDLDDMMGFGNTEYDIKGVSKTDGVQIKDVFKNVKGMAKAAGLTMNDVDIKSAIHRLEKSGMDKEVTNLTPEEQAAKAQEFIDKYSTQN